jgi:hypothetical protein
MDPKSVISPSERIAAAYKKLSVSAAHLNTVSDELGKAISSLDTALKRLNLGVSCWEKIVGEDDDNYGNYWSRDIGYAKVGDRWGIALRTTEGNLNLDHHDCDMWLFNDAPRILRIEAVEKLPALVEKLTLEADQTAARIKEKIAQAQELAVAVNPRSTAPVRRQER